MTIYEEIFAVIKQRKADYENGKYNDSRPLFAYKKNT